MPHNILECQCGNTRQLFHDLAAAQAEARRTKGAEIAFVVYLPPMAQQKIYEREGARVSLDVLMERYGEKCLDCGTNEELLVDHIIPLSRGGDSDIENLQVLCRTCNFRKGIKIINYRPFAFEKEIEYCRGCQKMRFTPFTQMYWMGEFVEVCDACLPEWEGSEAVINPSEAFAPNYLT